MVNDTAKAFADFSKVVQLNPKDATANEYLAIINFYKSNYKAAINNITKCIETGRHVASDYSKRAIFYSALQNYTAALPDFDEAIFWDQTNPNYYTLRGECNVNLKNYTAAYDDYGFATMLNPNDADSKKQLQKLDPLLKAEYEKMGFTPQNAYEFFLNRADKMAKLSEGYKLGPAAMNYYKCIQVEPKNPVPYNKAGKIFRDMKMNTYAEQFLRYAAYADGKNPEYFCDLGNYYFEYAEKPQMASGCYDTAALLGSKNAFGYYTNGLIKHSALKNFNGALKDYTAALAIDPAYKETLVMRGHLYYNEFKNYKAALADYEALGKLDPKNEEYKGFIKGTKEKLKE
jgi:tetratricopeptide (TPR) repeat protein